MDVLLVAYTYVISSEVTEPFSIVCAVFAALDIGMALLSICCGEFNYLETDTSDNKSEKNSKTNVIKPTTTNNSTNSNNNSDGMEIITIPNNIHKL